MPEESTPPSPRPTRTQPTPSELRQQRRKRNAERSARRAEIMTGRGRLAMAAVAVATVAVTGIAWTGVDALRSALPKTDLHLDGGPDGAVDILLVGTDSRTDAHGDPLSQQEIDMLRAGDESVQNTDTILLVRIPSDGSSATAISIPRDTYTDIPGYGKGKINSAYGVTKAEVADQAVAQGVDPVEANKQGDQAGREALISSVSELTGVNVDHYAEVGLLGFVLLTNAVGGVSVCLNNAVDEPLSGAHFKAGEQTLDGPDALSFVRQRHDLPRGDLDRIVRQQVFMASLVNKVLSARTLTDPTRVRALVNAASRSVLLDSDWDLIEFATQLQNLAGGKVQFVTIPVANLHGTSPAGESIVEVDRSAVSTFIANLVDANAAQDKDIAEVDPGKVQVDVVNAGSVSGLAAQVSAELSKLGYRPGEVGNARSGASGSSGPLAEASTDSVVLAHDADDAGAKSVAHALGGLPVHEDSSVAAGAVQVVLGSAYAGPGSAGFTDADQAAPSDDPTAEPVAPGPAITAASSGPRCVD